MSPYHSYSIQLRLTARNQRGRRGLFATTHFSMNNSNSPSRRRFGAGEKEAI